jgi:hypothetical protein
MFQRVVIVASLLLSLALPSLARASSEGVGPSGMHAVAPAPPPPPRPLATLAQLFEQLRDTRALVQGSVSDAVAAQLAHLRAAHSSSLLRR